MEALFSTSLCVPGFRIPDWGSEMEDPPGGKVSTLDEIQILAIILSNKSMNVIKYK